MAHGQTKLQESNVFTPICQSFCPQRWGWCTGREVYGQVAGVSVCGQGCLSKVGVWTGGVDPEIAEKCMKMKNSDVTA